MKVKETAKLKVAVTGGIGAGKSAFCGFIEEAGYTVVKVDDISKDILASDTGVKKEIIRAFGEKSFKGNSPDKKYLADIVFSNPSNVIKINSILHPKVIKKVETLLNESRMNEPVIFAEAALIYEADMEKMFDYVVLITADERVRMDRKIKNDKFTEDEFRKRDENQIRDEEKMKRADFTFTNNGTQSELKVKAGLLVNILKGLSAKNG